MIVVLLTLLVWALLVTGQAFALKRKIRRLAKTSVLRRVEACSQRHCTCVK